MSETVANQHPAGPRHNAARIERVKVTELRAHAGDPRKFSSDDIKRAEAFVLRFADRVLPIVVGPALDILTGGLFVAAARGLKLPYLHVVRQDDLDPQDELLYAIATNKLLSLGSWDGTAMDLAVREFERNIEGFNADLIGFAPGELDSLIGLSLSDPDADVLPVDVDHVVSSPGTIWRLNHHRVGCGDATDPATLGRLLNGRQAAAAICDPPFGCRIDGFVSKRGTHRDFVQASGEMDQAELRVFFDNACMAMRGALTPGALVYLFIDWRSLRQLQAAAEQAFGPMINMCVWAKDRAGMGSFYRSRHELVLVFGAPGAKHRNNIQLGRHGRNRSNLWEYPCAASSRKGREGDMLKLHPTPKSVEMIADAMLDCTGRGEIVLDGFLGSGTALIAAERTGRTCYGVDLDPRFADLAVRRWQRWTGGSAFDIATDRSFNEIEAELLAGGGQ